MTKKSFIYATTNGTRLQVNLPFELINGNKIKFPWLPILWDRDGLFRIVSVEKIKNESKEDSCVLLWNEAIPVDRTFARLLLGEDVKGKCAYSGKSTSAST